MQVTLHIHGEPAVIETQQDGSVLKALWDPELDPSDVIVTWDEPPQPNAPTVIFVHSKDVARVIGQKLLDWANDT